MILTKVIILLLCLLGGHCSILPKLVLCHKLFESNPKMTSFQYLLKLFLPFSTFSFITADIVPGKCPKVMESTLNCIQICGTTGQYGTILKTYGMLRSSPNTTPINLFGFDFSKIIVSLNCVVDRVKVDIPCVSTIPFL